MRVSCNPRWVSGNPRRVSSGFLGNPQWVSKCTHGGLRKIPTVGCDDNFVRCVMVGTVQGPGPRISHPFQCPRWVSVSEAQSIYVTCTGCIHITHPSEQICGPLAVCSSS